MAEKEIENLRWYQETEMKEKKNSINANADLQSFFSHSVMCVCVTFLFWKGKRSKTFIQVEQGRGACVQKKQKKLFLPVKTLSLRIFLNLPVKETRINFGKQVVHFRKNNICWDIKWAENECVCVCVT